MRKFLLSVTAVVFLFSVAPHQAAHAADFVGRPKTMQQLLSCKVVGNYNSMIYHLKGSPYIKKMNVKNKECFKTEAAAKKKGFRKSK